MQARKLPNAVRSRVPRASTLVAWALALSTLTVLGCFTTKPEQPHVSFAPGASGLPIHHGPTGEDAVQLMIAVVEMPLGDDYLNDEVWDWVNEQQIDFDRKQLLEANGFRAGVFGGTPPTKLQGMIASDRCHVRPRRIRMFEDKERPIVMGQVHPQGVFDISRKQRITKFEKEKVQCRLVVTPMLKEDGRVRLRFKPEIQHGEPNVTPRPVLEPSGTRRWEMQLQHEVESFDWLRWDLTISPEEFVLIGVDLRKPNTLGRGCFLAEPEDKQGRTPVQRLLILRALPAKGDHLDEELLGKGTPLAAQATLRSANKTRTSSSP